MEKPVKADLKGSINLGKPSLRLRLEAYYTLIDPSRIQDQSLWRQNVDDIYKKYGGSYEGERKLSAKLAKKYGTTVRLLLAKPEESKEASKPPKRVMISDNSVKEFDESWYITKNGTGDINFCSERFDPEAALKSSIDKVAASNPWFNGIQISILDNTLQFKRYLPIEDPLYQDQKRAKRSLKSDGSSRETKSHPFDAIGDSFETGPFSVLRKFQRQRRKVRVITRYVNAIRGCLTGTLVAFDKHMNLILRDVEEVYSPRPIERNSTSNVDAELKRRRNASAEESSSNKESLEGWSVRRRKMKQMMLRGDNVVSIYKADDAGKPTTTGMDSTTIVEK